MAGPASPWTPQAAAFRRALAGPVLASFAAAWPVQADAQDALRGAALYMRAPGDSRSCINCHGADPGSSPNNILRAAGNSAALTKALNTVGAMGFLGSALSDADRADLSAFLASVATQAAAGQPQLWPTTAEFGSIATGSASAVQRLRLRNGSPRALPVAAIRAAHPALALTHDCPPFLAPASNCTIELQWRNAATGSSSTGIAIDTAPEQPPLLAAALVFGIAAPVSSLSWDTGGTLAFGGTDAISRRELVLHNTGPMPAKLGLLTVLGPEAPLFTASGCERERVLQAGTSCTVSLAWQPGTARAGEASLQLRSDQGNPASVLLAGTTTLESPGSGIAVPPPGDTPIQPPLAAAPEGGGGCSSRDTPAARPDLALLLLVAAAFAALRLRLRLRLRTQDPHVRPSPRRTVP